MEKRHPSCFSWDPLCKEWPPWMKSTLLGFLFGGKHSHPSITCWISGIAVHLFCKETESYCSVKIVTGTREGFWQLKQEEWECMRACACELHKRLSEDWYYIRNSTTLNHCSSHWMFHQITITLKVKYMTDALNYLTVRKIMLGSIKSEKWNMTELAFVTVPGFRLFQTIWWEEGSY